LIHFYKSAKMMSVMKAASSRRAEKALKEILDKADDDANGRVRLKDFVHILEANDVKVEEEEMENFMKLVDENGEISKHDLIIQTKQSSFWSGHLDLKNAPCGHSTKVEVMSGSPKAKKKVEVMNKAERSAKADTAFKLFDRNKDGFITREEFVKASKNLTREQIELVFQRFDANKDGKLSRAEFQRLMESRK